MNLKFWEKKGEDAGKAIVTIPKTKAGSSYLTYLSSDEISPDKLNALMKKFKSAYEQVPIIYSMINVQADQVVQEFYFRT